jgi:magnesium-transporting ATPase (P-type)
MLWVNLIMDSLAALALATETPSDKLLDRMPYKKDENIVTPAMWKNIIGLSIYESTILMLILIYGEEFFGVKSSMGMGVTWT